MRSTGCLAPKAMCSQDDTRSWDARTGQGATAVSAAVQAARELMHPGGGSATGQLDCSSWDDLWALPSRAPRPQVPGVAHLGLGGHSGAAGGATGSLAADLHARKAAGGRGLGGGAHGQAGSHLRCD